ncbi:MAG: hypothetical protein ACSHX3_03425 [Litorimonas sp.]
MSSRRGRCGEYGTFDPAPPAASLKKGARRWGVNPTVNPLVSHFQDFISRFAEWTDARHITSRTAPLTEPHRDKGNVPLVPTVGTERLREVLKGGTQKRF